MNRKYFLLLTLIFLSGLLFAKTTTAKNSYVEFPAIVMVGRIVAMTPYSIIVENSETETNIDNSFVKHIREKYQEDIDFRGHGFANALKLVSIEKNHMRLNFYLDNIPTIFHFDISTYTKFLPVLFMVENNLKNMKVPTGLREALATPDAMKYLKTPFVKDLMNNSWFVGVFTVHPESGKLVYQSSRYYASLDDLLTDEYAHEHRVPDMIHHGLAVTVTKSIIRGNEASRARPDNDKKSGDGGDGNIGTSKTPSIGGGK